MALMLRDGESGFGVEDDDDAGGRCVEGGVVV